MLKYNLNSRLFSTTSWLSVLIIQTMKNILVTRQHPLTSEHQNRHSLFLFLFSGSGHGCESPGHSWRVVGKNSKTSVCGGRGWVIGLSPCSTSQILFSLTRKFPLRMVLRQEIRFVETVSFVLGSMLACVGWTGESIYVRSRFDL